MQRHDNYNSRGRRGGMLLRVFDVVIIVFTVAAAAALLCAYISPYVNPNGAWVFAFAGMAAPVLYIANLSLALYWVIRWRRFALVPAVALLIGIGWVSLFFKPSLGRHRSDDMPRRAMTVMTYNVEGFNGAPIDSTLAFIASCKPDILCLQEFQTLNVRGKALIDSLLGMPYSAHYYSVPNRSGGGFGLAIYSRHRILGSEQLPFERTSNSAMWADVAAGGDTLRVFNCHLQSTSISREDVEYVEDFANEESAVRTRNIAAKLRRTFGMRAVQVDSLSPLIRLSPHPPIVCGDFNDTPMSYAYHKVRGRMADSFVESGSGIPSTYQGLFDLLRIDYVLHARRLRAVGYDSPEVGYSDHKPVVVKLVAAD